MINRYIDCVSVAARHPFALFRWDLRDIADNSEQGRSMHDFMSPARLDSDRYVGRHVYTADNQHLGIINDICTDETSGEQFLLVERLTGPDDDKELCISSRDIGIVSHKRVTLDVTSSKLEHDTRDRIDIDPIWN
jgi:hypothetical protein